MLKIFYKKILIIKNNEIIFENIKTSTYKLNNFDNRLEYISTNYLPLMVVLHMLYSAHQNAFVLQQLYDIIYWAEDIFYINGNFSKQFLQQCVSLNCVKINTIFPLGCSQYVEEYLEREFPSLSKILIELDSKVCLSSPIEFIETCPTTSRYSLTCILSLLPTSSLQ